MATIFKMAASIRLLPLNQFKHLISDIGPQFIIMGPSLKNSLFEVTLPTHSICALLTKFYGLLKYSFFS